MNIPPFEKMLRPILAMSADAPITRALAAEAMTRHFQLSKEETTARIPSGGATYVANRAGWAMTFLTKGGLIEKVAPRQYQATPRGREFLTSHPELISESDLKAIDGWHEAWKSNALASEPSDSDNEPDSSEIEARIKKKLHRCLPDAGARTAALEFLAFALETADAERSDSWTLAERSDGLELKAGRLVVCRIRNRRIDISAMGPLTSTSRDALGLSAEEDYLFARVPGGMYLRISETRVESLTLVKDAAAIFIAAAVSRIRRAVDQDDHSPEAVSCMSTILHRELPNPHPSSATLRADTDVDDELDEGSELSRDPKVRGRAPIFEHGQRAIASLMEDINPEQGTIALPDLQRPFVWEDTKVRDLLDSLFIGFPVGTLVLWHAADARDSRAVGALSPALRATALVIDGQQRLTSLFAVMRGKTVASKDGSTRAITIAFRPRDGRFEVADAAIKRDPEFIANITELWSGPRTKVQIRRELLIGLESAGRQISDSYIEAVEINLDRAHSIQDYRFPTVEIRKTTSAEDIKEEDVADIFVRINNQGSRLVQADFVLTLLSVYHGALRDRIERSAQEMSNDAIVPIDTQQLLRIACAVGFGRARMAAVYKFLRGVDPSSGDSNPLARAERLKVLDRATEECLDMTAWRDYMLRVMHAGFVAPSLIASTGAITNAYAVYILGKQRRVPKQQLEQVVSRWVFGTLVSARYSSSSETRYEEDLARIRETSPNDPKDFVQTLDHLLSNILTEEFWARTVPSALETQRGRAPTALAFRAAQVILGARALFGDQLLQNLLVPPGAGARSASEVHHLFPKDWLRRSGIVDSRKINQVANLADVGWHENVSMGGESPGTYVQRLRDLLGINDDRWARMCAEHALPIDWQKMDYESFLAARRPRMAEIIRIGYRKLGGEPEAPPLSPPWFLPGAEMVWKRIGETELRMRAVIRATYNALFGSEAARVLTTTLSESERDSLKRNARNLPPSADPLALIDYLYLAQLPPLLFRSDVWAALRSRIGGDHDTKKNIQDAFVNIIPVRNEMAHVREVSEERLQRASLACGDLLRMIANVDSRPA